MNCWYMLEGSYAVSFIWNAAFLVYFFDSLAELILRRMASWY